MGVNGITRVCKGKKPYSIDFQQIYAIMNLKNVQNLFSKTKIPNDYKLLFSYPKCRAYLCPLGLRNDSLRSHIPAESLPKVRPALYNLRIYRQCFWMFSEKTSAGEAEASFRREFPKALIGSMQQNNNLSCRYIMNKGGVLYD